MKIVGLRVVSSVASVWERMISMKPECPSFIPVAALSLLLSFPAFSQGDGLEALIEKSQGAMKGQHWEQALDFQTEVTERYGRNDPLRTYGAQFGTIYYQKGICEMKLKRWDAAMRSFQTCYQDFPDDGAVSGAGNPHQILALCKWGEAALGAEKWELAEGLFIKFVEERDRVRDPYPQGAYYVNIAICQYKQGRIAEGNENLEIAIQNKLNFPTPESGIVAGFQALAGAAIEQRNEQVLLDFMGKNRGALVIDSPENPRNAGVFLKLAGDAFTAGMQGAALAMYQLVPTSPSAGADDPAGIRLAAIALIHETHKNIRGAFAAYEQLVKYHPGATKREEYVYQLIRTASIIGESGLARKHAVFLYQSYPESAHLAELRTMNFDFNGEPAVVIPRNTPAATALPESSALAAALDLYQGRKYQEAKAAFQAVKTASSSPGNVTVFAAFYEMECLRKLGDLEGLAKAHQDFERNSMLGGMRLRQLEIHDLWDAVRLKDWSRVDQRTKDYNDLCLPGDQRAQVAYCEGLALENSGHAAAALNAYNTAMTADAGTSEEITRQSALNVLRIHCMDPEVQAAMASWGTPEEDRGSQGFSRLQEAAAVAGLYELSLGANAPLPEEFRELLKYQSRN